MDFCFFKQEEKRKLKKKNRSFLATIMSFDFQTRRAKGKEEKYVVFFSE
jgi:hypothetical protein